MPGSKNSTNDASSMTHVTASSTRSMMIVAKVAVALSPSCRARRYGRITSPARAGSTALAAKPIVVVRNAGANRACPIGSSRYCHRRARSTIVITVTAADSAISHGFASLISVQTISRWAPRKKIASKPIESRTMTTVRSDFLILRRGAPLPAPVAALAGPHRPAPLRDLTRRKRASTIRGVWANAKNALVVVLSVLAVLDKIGAFRPSTEVSHCHRRVSFSKHLSTV